MTSVTVTAANGWDDGEVGAVHQAFGLALNAAAAMEKSVLSLLMHHRLDCAAQEGRILMKGPCWEKVVRLPLKEAVRIVAGRMYGDCGLDTTLLAAADRRNYLAHDFYWDNTERFFAPGPRSRLVKQLVTDTAVFHQLCVRVNSIDDTLIEKLYGRAPDYAEAREEIIRRASAAQ